MELRIFAAPAVEPISLQEMKEHLRLDSGDFSDNLSTTTLIPPGAQVVTAGYSIIGSYVDVLGMPSLVCIASGVVAGQINCKVQDSDDHTNWGDVGSVVTITNSNTKHEIAYTGAKRYVRVIAQVLTGTSNFGAYLLTYLSGTTEDDLLSAAITAARQQAEAITRRALITQTWDMALDAFPMSDAFNKATRAMCEILLPLGRLQSIYSFAYTKESGEEVSLTTTTDYLADTFSEPGRLVLPLGVSWPSFSLYAINAVRVRFVCGYGDTAETVPATIRAAIKMMAADLYANRESQEMVASGMKYAENKTVMNLLDPYILRSFG